MPHPRRPQRAARTRRHLVDGSGQTRRVVHKGGLNGQQAVETADGCRIGSARGSQTLQGATLLVDGVDGSLQALGRNLDAALFLDLGGKLFNLGLPGHERRLIVHVGDIHDVHVLLRGKELVGLLLAIAGVLAYHQVTRLNVGADLAQLKAGKALDERAGVAGQMLLDLVGRPVGTRAQAHGNAVAGEHNLLGHVDAERAHDLGGLAGLLLVEHLLNTAAVDVGGDKNQVGCGLGGDCSASGTYRRTSGPRRPAACRGRQDSCRDSPTSDGNRTLQP